MTVDLSEYFGVTIHHAERVGPRLFRSHGEIFRRDTFQVVARIEGEGARTTSADDRAIAAAHEWVRKTGACVGTERAD